VEPVRVIYPELVLVDWGPMTLTISVWDRKKPRPVMAARAAITGLSCLEKLADFQRFLRKPVHRLPATPNLPASAAVVRRAFHAARNISPELSPLAAVAGATADQVATAAAQMGADRVVANNGGDIALRLGPTESAVVGLRLRNGGESVGRLTIRGGTGIGGVASSGWGGRSHSAGTADLATVWAENAAIADAAATLIAGDTAVDGPEIGRAPACDIDPLSDLGKRPVTLSIGRLNRAGKARALARAAATARRLYAAGHILGCCLWIQGEGFALDPGGILTM